VTNHNCTGKWVLLDGFACDLCGKVLSPACQRKVPIVSDPDCKRHTTCKRESVGFGLEAKTGNWNPVCNLHRFWGSNLFYERYLPAGAGVFLFNSEIVEQ